MRYLSYFIIAIVCCLSGCEFTAINSPYTVDETDQRILYSSFTLRPKHLDPARSYSSNEASFTGQIYEPPLQYHYLKRPYELEPLTATQLPTVDYFDTEGVRLDDTAETEKVAYSVYTLSIKENILFQPHPAFVKDKQGEFLYHELNSQQLESISTLADFKQVASRELTAKDYVYQIKRLAHPKLHSPILGLMSEYIVGLADYAKDLRQHAEDGDRINLRDKELEGVTVLDRYRYQIKVIGKYPQLRYWLAMPFFSAVLGSG